MTKQRPDEHDDWQARRYAKLPADLNWCLYCPHVAERHSQSDDSVYCAVCLRECYKPANIDDSRWIGDWYAGQRP